MRVTIHTVEQGTGIETFDNEEELDVVLQQNPELADDMEAALFSSGRYYVGGGAAPLFIIRPVPPAIAK